MGVGKAILNRHLLSWISGVSRTVVAAGVLSAGIVAAMGASLAAAQSRTVRVSACSLPRPSTICDPGAKLLRPLAGLRPITPQADAGTRIEPEKAKLLAAS